jgi:hypothetical protein
MEGTITPSQNILTAFAAMQERVGVLEDLMAWMPSPDRHGIGGNFPPEPIEDAPLSGAEWSELRQLVVVLRSQTAIPEEKPVKAIEAEGRLKVFADKIRSFLGRWTSGVVNVLSEAVAAEAVHWWTVHYGHSALSHLAEVLASSSDAVQSWLHLLGY